MLRLNRSLDRIHAKISAIIIRTEIINNTATRNLGAATKQRNTLLVNINKIRDQDLVKRYKNVKKICELVNPIINNVGDITD